MAGTLLLPARPTDALYVFTCLRPRVTSWPNISFDTVATPSNENARRLLGAMFRNPETRFYLTVLQTRHGQVRTGTLVLVPTDQPRVCEVQFYADPVTQPRLPFTHDFWPMILEEAKRLRLHRLEVQVSGDQEAYLKVLDARAPGLHKEGVLRAALYDEVHKRWWDMHLFAAVLDEEETEGGKA